MPEQRRKRTFLVVLLIVIVAIATLLTRCACQNTPAPSDTPPQPAPAGAPQPSAPSTITPGSPEPEEALTPATLTAPERVLAGATFTVSWTGPDNRADYVTVVRKDAPDRDVGLYQETKLGRSLELTAPVEPGPHEIRYVAGRSRTILARAAIDVTPAAATLSAPAEVILGAPFSIAWTGPNNKGDYITVVAKGAPDTEYTSYTDADKPSPQTLTAPTAAGDAELRYITGQKKIVLARRALRVVMPQVSVSGPAEATAGTTIEVAWTGPSNTGDYVTVVAADLPDGKYGNYTLTSTGSPLKLQMPIMDGAAELRYMTGQGAKVLARAPIKVVAAKVTLAAPAEGAADAPVSITWTGPNNTGDYITIVTKDTPDGRYGDYAPTTKGSPLSVKLPKTAGDAEIRYMTGQGGKVLARLAIKVTP